MSMTAGWHPDPHGRAHFRWWDGAAWGDRVSTWGQEWADPPGIDGRVDASLLGEPQLTFGYGACGGLEHGGQWSIWDGAQQPRGVVVVEMTNLNRRTVKYTVLNTRGEVVLVVDPREGLGNSETDVYDWAGRAHGVLDLPAIGGGAVQFNVGGMVYGQAQLANQGGGVFQRPTPVTHTPTNFLDANGVACGYMVSHESRRHPLGLSGPAPGDLQPEQSYFELHRPPNLVEPLRSFTFAMPMADAGRSAISRYNLRHDH